MVSETWVKVDPSEIWYLFSLFGKFVVCSACCSTHYQTVIGPPIDV